MEKKKLRCLAAAALFCALIFVVTAYMPRIPIAGGAGGYIHFGDAIIYLAASLLPLPYAVSAGAVGAVLADSLTGYLPWALGSLIIKAATAAVFSNKSEKIITKRNIVACAAAVLICAGGYFLYEWLIVYRLFLPENAGEASAVIVAANAIVSNLVQGIASVIIYLAAGFALDKIKFKRFVVGKTEEK